MTRRDLGDLALAVALFAGLSVMAFWGIGESLALRPLGMEDARAETGPWSR